MRCSPLSPGRLAALAVAASLIGAQAEAQTTEALDEAERAAVEQVVRDYLLANPEVVIEALNVYQARQDQLASEAQQQQLAALAERIFDSATSPVAGNPDGDVTLVEFFDYNCGYCKRVRPTVEALVADDPDLRLVFKEFPILSQGSVVAAQAALAAQWQDLYEPFHYAMMGFEGRLDEAQVFALAEEVGLDLDRLREDMSRPEVLDEIAGNMELARALQINGTPAFVVGDRVVPGAVDREVLEEAIAEARGS